MTLITEPVREERLRVKAKKLTVGLSHFQSFSPSPSPSPSMCVFVCVCIHVCLSMCVLSV